MNASIPCPDDFATTMDSELTDPDLVFAKTPDGEEAILQRTRVVQRNVRMVLILVDGNATVAELCEKTGNAELTQNALVELERDGFIERRVEKNSVWQHARNSSKGIAASAIHQAVSEFSTFGEKSVITPVKSPSSDRREGRVIPFPDSREAQRSRPPGSLAPEPSLSAQDSDFAKPPDLEATAEPELQAAAANAEPAPSIFDRLKSLSRPPTADDKADIKPIRRGGPGWSLTWPMGVLLGSLLLGAVLFLAALFFPYTHYLPAVEAILAQSTGQAAKVDDMRLSLYPKPGLLLGNVRLGEGTDPIHITEVRLWPALDTLLSPKVLFSEVELTGVRLSAAAIASLSRMLATAAREPAQAGVLHVTVSQAEVFFAGLAVSEMSGHFELSAERLLEAVALNSPDRSLQVTLKPTDRGATIQVEGLAWRPAPGSPYLFDSVNLQGEIDGTDCVINRLELRIFDGLVRGATVLRAQPAMTMAGEISFERINSRKLVDALGAGSQLEGDARGRLKFSASSESWAALFSALQASGDFTIHRGRLIGIDLAEAMRRVSATPVTLGGWTRFEELSGAITLTPSSSRFSRLLLSAGLMQSSGQIEVSRDLQLRGRMDVVLRGSADRAARRILISGSLKTPLTQTANR